MTDTYLEFPQIDPVLFEVGPLAIRWYALAYVAGIFIGWWLLKRLSDKTTPPLMGPKALDDIMLYAIFGIILGGRLGYVLFYNLPFYLENPLMALQIWKGGMSFHGGLAGVILAMILFARRFEILFLKLMDLLAVVAPIGLFFGRIANFINGELWGRVADVPWGMIFPSGGNIVRHPSQLYEAALEGVVLFVILFILISCTRVREKAGMLSGLFLLGYGAARGFVEQYREPDQQVGFLWESLTMGQLLSTPMILGGLFLIFWSLRKRDVAA
ncbi:MAG: prolipoprotein diacylglyceryl transferase [Rickettsiales bacterium]|nr:prolipoprotein diacylglyceryl transferase [Rickettsiales bacterium]